MRRSFLRAAALFLVLLLLLLPLCGCAAEKQSGEVRIVCTIFPLYDFVTTLLGTEEGVLLLSDNGNDPHNYQPTVRDIIAVENAALFLYVGGISDAWATEIAKPKGTFLALIDAVELCESDHDHAEGEHDHHGHDHSDVDEHFWLSLSNAKKAVSAIAETLRGFDFTDAEIITANETAYLASLSALEARYHAAVDSAACREIMVADRFPFQYLVSELHLTHYAAFPGCSAETEASFSTVVTLSEIFRTHALPVLLVTETGDRALAETVLRVSGRTDAEILVLHSCQSVTRAERENGTDYLSIMEENLGVLVRALSCESPAPRDTK